MILISKDPLVQGVEEESDIRHLIIAKNKLTGGWHGQIDCRLDIEKSQLQSQNILLIFQFFGY